MSNVYTFPCRRAAAVHKTVYTPRACVEDIRGAWGLF